MKKMIALVLILGLCGFVYAANNDEVAINLHRLPGATLSIQEASITYDVPPGAAGWDVDQIIHVDGSYTGTGTVSTYVNGYSATQDPEWGTFLAANGLELGVTAGGGFLTDGGKGPVVDYAAFPTPANAILLGTSVAGNYDGTASIAISFSKTIFNTVLGNGSEATFHGGLTIVSLVN